MDEKELQLYHEENRQALLDIKDVLGQLKTVLNKQLEEYQPTEKVEVSGKVQVNTEKSVEVSNLEEAVESINNLGEVITKAIKDNSFKPPKSVTVENIKEAQAESVKISNLSDIKSYFDELANKIENNQPIIQTTKQEVFFPKNPKEALPVRLSDGKSFYNALAAVAAGGGIPEELIDRSGADPVIRTSATLTGGGDASAANQTTMITELQDIETDIEATNTRIGEVQASPTANTVLDRLKTIGSNTSGGATSAKQDTGNSSLSSIDSKIPDESGTWGYSAGTSGTVTLTGSKRVLQITAIALEAAGTITINGGDTITLPYGSTDKASSSITIEPKGNLTDPTIIFSGTDSYFVEYVS